MKHFYVLLALAFVFPLLSSAQYLADNLTAANPLFKREVPAPRSQWEKEQDLVNGHISNSKLSKMKMVTEAIVTFFHDSCISDEQVNPLWHGEYFSEKTSLAPQIKFGVFCNFYEQKAHLSVIANDISPLLDHLVVNNQDFLTIKPVAAIKNDCPYFETIAQDAETGKSLRSKVWLVTTGNGQLPYIPVTRKEYLQEARLELINSKNNIVTDWKQKIAVRPAAVQEADKKAALEQLSTMYSGMDLQVRTKMFLSNYQTDEEYLRESTNKGTAGLDCTLHLMDSLLNHEKADDLNKPAIVSVEAASFRGFGDGHSDKMLIRMNPSYFNPDFSSEQPQLFLIRWSYDPSEPMADGIDRQIQERLDCQKLKEMLRPINAE
jgi:hypothetical protein